MDLVLDMAGRAKSCTGFIAGAKTGKKNRVLSDIAKKLIENTGAIVGENEKDIGRCRKEGISESLLDRLVLNKERIDGIAKSIDKVISFTDPVGEVIHGYNLPNGLVLKNIRVPLGVVGIIYEARPNVTVDAAVLCLKSGNCVILRGSSHALQTNKKLTEIMREALKENDFPEDIIQVIPSAGRDDVLRLMELRDYVDVLIPRGGANLIASVVENSKVPVIETGIGNCHIYIDSELEGINLEEITAIVVNAKTQRPGVCNAAEKLLVHRQAAATILPPVLEALGKKGVELLGCPESLKIYPSMKPALEEDWYREFLDLKMAVKVLDSVEEAVAHINKYGSHHTESIITSSYRNSNYFTVSVDSSTVFVNASTRFTDGEELGMGAEIGISTQKLHRRGPMGLRELTTNKFIVLGNGQVRV
ncbi:MAG: glutamate-5-semialdehyde dehydrogenase [Actinobacteria bacterium]|nr:glutamate-5-semialdehyde dehydrogenase [Actinomycetota bacterium]